MGFVCNFLTRRLFELFKLDFCTASSGGYDHFAFVTVLGVQELILFSFLNFTFQLFHVKFEHCILIKSVFTDQPKPTGAKSKQADKYLFTFCKVLDIRQHQKKNHLCKDLSDSSLVQLCHVTKLNEGENSETKQNIL